MEWSHHSKHLGNLKLQDKKMQYNIWNMLIMKIKWKNDIFLGLKIDVRWNKSSNHVLQKHTLSH